MESNKVVFCLAQLKYLKCPEDLNSGICSQSQISTHWISGLGISDMETYFAGTIESTWGENAGLTWCLPICELASNMTSICFQYVYHYDSWLSKLNYTGLNSLFQVSNIRD